MPLTIVVWSTPVFIQSTEYLLYTEDEPSQHQNLCVLCSIKCNWAMACSAWLAQNAIFVFWMLNVRGSIVMWNCVILCVVVIWYVKGPILVAVSTLPKRGKPANGWRAFLSQFLCRTRLAHSIRMVSAPSLFVSYHTYLYMFYNLNNPRILYKQSWTTLGFKRSIQGHLAGEFLPVREGEIRPRIHGFWQRD